MLVKNARFGYACINMDLQENEKVQCNRRMIKRTFLSRGVPYASELALSNVKGLKRVIEWNNENGVEVYRMTSCLFPWVSEYELEDLPDFDEITDIMKQAGEIAMNAGQRLSFHPGQFCVLASPTEKVVLSAADELNKHGQMMDIMGLPRSPAAKINIHVGGTYGGDFAGTAERWCRNFFKLSINCQNRLTVENDDKASMWSTRHLYDYIHKVIHIPIVFDYHHHKFCTGGQTEQEALELAMSTWHGVTPVVHYSQDRSVEHNDPKIRPQAHSDSYWTAIETYGHDIDVMLECKHKEQGLFKMRQLLEEKVSLAA